MQRSKIALVATEDEPARDVIEHLVQAGFHVTFIALSPSIASDLLQLDAQIVLYGIWDAHRVDLDQLADLCRLLLVPLVVIGGPTNSLLAVDALNCGADGYLEASCSHDFVQAYVEATMRRYWEWSPRHQQSQAAPLSVVTRRDGQAQEVQLTPDESRVLSYLLENIGQVVPKDKLAWHAWGRTPEDRDMRSLSACIRNLRAKIERDPRHPQFLLTRWGVGYSLSEEFHPS